MYSVFFLRLRRPTRSTRTAPLFPDTTLLRSGAKRDTVQHQTFGVQRITLDVRVAGRRRGGEIDHRAFMAAARSFGDVECDFRSHRPGNGIGARAANRATDPNRVFDQEWEQGGLRSEEHTSELQSLLRISYAVFCLKNKNQI